MRLRSRFAFFAIVFLAAVSASYSVHAQGESASQTGRLITRPIDESNLVTLAGNTRPEANATNDRGRAYDSFPIEHIQLQLQLSAEKEQTLDQLIRDLHDPASPYYHKWLTPDEFKRQFSVAPEDIDAVTSWLQSKGFTINVVYPRSIDFSGTAGQVRDTFRSEIHNLDVNGVRHFANMSDPKIPMALAPAIIGVVSLNDFMPHTLSHPRTNYTTGSGSYLVVPADLATIYNFNPVFARGISGQGQTIVVIEDTDVYSAVDWNTFRTALGLSAYNSGSFTQVHPAPVSGTNNCADPGVNGDDAEAILDAEWASASAPSAAIVLASCADTSNFGGFLALQNLLNANNPPPIVSISYGESESELGAAGNSYINALYKQAVTEGVSIFVSSGDEGAASSDANLSYASHGSAVSGFTSTPYNISVGGTDFGDTFTGSSNIYWNSTNTSTYESAKSYVPEIPWNDSCASGLIASYLGFATTYGSSGFCNSSTGMASFLNTVAASGGPSGCATGAPATNGVVGGSCVGYAKPTWQSVLGNPSDGVRDVPDLSLFAANGVWGHYYVVCYSDTGTGRGGSPCTGAPNTWSGFGGTSLASPIMAAIQALVNQTSGNSAGNPNPTYYSLASGEYGAAGNPACNSTLGSAVSSSCIFYDVTQGDIDVACRGARNCYLPSGTYGVLSKSNSQYQPAYAASGGWDFATGIGTVNVNNLVNNWPKPPSITSGPSVTFTVGIQGTFTVAASGTPAPTLTESGTLPGGITFNVATGVLGGSPAADTSGSYSISFTASNGVGANAVQSFALTVNQPPAITSTNSATFTVNAQGAFQVVATGFPTPALTESGTLPGGITFNAATGVLSGSPAAGTSGSYNISFTANNSVDTNAVQSFTLTVQNPTGASGASVAFVIPDTTTQGHWSQDYGADGYSLANANQVLPSYDPSFAAQSQLNWTWTSNTTDPRALQLPNGSGEIAAAWYSSSSFSFDVNISSGTHSVALYALDWDNQARAETIQILDATTNAVLDTRGISGFTNGLYLVWNISGHVTIKVSHNSGANAVISGIFFGGGSPTEPANPVLTITKTHSGNFAAGQQNATYSVTVSNAANATATTGAVTVTETVPSGLTLVSMAGTGWTCSLSSCTRSDALSAAASYPSITVTVNVAANASSPQVNQVSVSGGGSATANASDSTTITGTSSNNSATFVTQDANTEGSWQGVYGADGYSLANASQMLPSYDPSFAVQNEQSWTWASSTTDPRALRLPTGLGAIAATWYSSSSFSFDVNISSGTHSVALYALDWDSQARAETIQILDATTNGVLDTRSISGFANGVYLVWNISGHVTINVSHNGGANAVISGIFFGGGSPTEPANPVLSITKTHSGNFAAGQQNATYSVTVSNAANATATTGAVTVTETVPSGLTLVSMAGTGWTCSLSSCTRSDALSAAASYPSITVTVNVAANASSPQVNQVSVSGGGSVTANASDSTTITGTSSNNSATFVTQDANTEGSWQGVYGADGYSLANANQVLPSYDPSFAVRGQLNWTWASNTTDPRALRLPGGSGAIAATWYNGLSFSFDVNISSGTHSVALYALDWDNQARAETIQILDATTNAVLDTRSISGFTNGVYLVWNISGHVTIKVSYNSGANAVISGIFFN